MSYTSALGVPHAHPAGAVVDVPRRRPAARGLGARRAREAGLQDQEVGEPAGEPLADPSDPVFFVRPTLPGAAPEPVEPLEELVVDLLPEAEWCSAELVVNCGGELRWERV